MRSGGLKLFHHAAAGPPKVAVEVLKGIQVLQAMGLPDPPTPLFKPLIWTSFNIIWKSHVWKSHSLLDYLIQLVHGTEQVLPTMIWYMVVVLEK